ncbi:xylulokinase [Paenalkalicoccus suaedae]|uniref:Xylulose kinase n=1 Tax=Paenalkalicoccus suaedae TaxID=2592382 RepID=A0A859FJJ3_9BACI|nr:xylulokinase [Paenalkalicoccus suaedae]QKS72956.1 xylulokinase [Paenalkalicoccus suaedae]
MEYVIGVDLGTSAVKVLVVAKGGTVVSSVSKSYPLYHDKPGYSEQDPDDWVRATVEALEEVSANVNPNEIKGISFSGQMHGLVLLDDAHKPLRRAILWNDTRTTEQCRFIEDVASDIIRTSIKNPVLEGFTLPKLLWVKEHEPEIFEQAATFVLPKDYVRLALTGELHMEFSDAAGTLLLDVEKREWSHAVANAVGLPLSLCPPLIDSHEVVGSLKADLVAKTGMASAKVVAGGADNACGAIGTGILKEGTLLSSIGTSGVVLAFEQSATKSFSGTVHYFAHAAPDAHYTMGVTLAAGHSLTWLKETAAKETSFDNLVSLAEQSPIGAKGLLFTPYLSGERSPHADSAIRGSFIGLHASHEIGDLTRAVMEGITFSLNESVVAFREEGIQIDRVIATGGGAKSDAWMQMQADIYQAEVVQLTNEQGPGIGAAMLAAYGVGLYNSLEKIADTWTEVKRVYKPIPSQVEAYADLFKLYQRVYETTKQLSYDLEPFRHAGVIAEDKVSVD